MIWAWLARAGLTAACAGLLWMIWPVQDADDTFAPRISQPAFGGQTFVVVDEGHLNVHTAGGRYRPFTKLLTADGLRVLRGEGRITAAMLRRAALYITVNPLGLAGVVQQAANLAGLERVVRLRPDAFTTEEVVVLEAWVRAGGSALIVADHAPAGPAARHLAAAFGVEMTTWWAEDERHADEISRAPGALVFSRADGLLVDHPIVNGRSPDERVDRVVTFTGQALRASTGELLLRLSDSAREYPYRVSREREGRSAAGLAQAVAVRHGAGRVVIMGEAAALTAQRVEVPGQTPLKLGLTREDADNARFATNVIRWLLRVLG